MGLNFFTFAAQIIDMWQRIQTLYLIVGIILAVSALFTAVITVETPSGTIDVSPLLFDAAGAGFGGWPLLILWGGYFVLSVAAALKFKNRAVQMRLIRYSYFLLLLVVITELTLIYLWREGMAGDAVVSYGGHLIMPFAAFLFSFMAFKRIKKDDNLVKSVDRLR